MLITLNKPGCPQVLEGGGEQDRSSRSHSLRNSLLSRDFMIMVLLKRSKHSISLRPELSSRAHRTPGKSPVINIIGVGLETGVRSLGRWDLRARRAGGSWVLYQEQKAPTAGAAGASGLGPRNSSYSSSRDTWTRDTPCFPGDSRILSLISTSPLSPARFGFSVCL